jgi:hypothetical protein
MKFEEIKKQLEDAIELINELHIPIKGGDLNATLLAMSLAEQSYYKAIAYKDCFIKDEYKEIDKLDEKYGRIWNKKLDFSNLFKIILRK